MSKEEVQIDSIVNELYAKTKVTQKIRNETENPLELKIYFYEDKKSLFTSFSAELGDLIKVKSKIIKKEKAEEKYSDNISSGNSAIFVCRDPYDENKLIINLGNLPPKQDLTFISEHIQYLESSNKYEYELFKNLPIISCSEYFSPEIKGKIEIKTKNKLTISKKIFENDLNIIEEKFSEEENNYCMQYDFNKKKESDDKEKEKKDKKLFDSDSDDEEKKAPKKKKINKIYFEIEQQPLILYRQKSSLIENQNNYIIQYKHNANNFDTKSIANTNLSPAIFIFLVDQSCSMRDEPIRVTCKALVLFLQSLPAGSYYQLIGFGTKYAKYDYEPREYTQENITYSIERARYLQANMGGTDLYHPLKDIYESHEMYDKLNLPKNIFILTDGESFRRKDALKLIEENNEEFSVYSIGIGDYFDEEFIKQAGILGKGNYNFCQDISDLKNIIASQIKSASKPFITGLKINSSLNSKCIYNSNDKSLLIKNNHYYYFKYVLDGKNDIIENDKIKLEIEYIWSNKNKQIENYEIPIEQIQSSEELSKLIINEYLLENKDLKEEESTNLALKYRIISNYTSLFAELEFSDKVSEEMKLIVIGDKENNIIRRKKPSFQEDYLDEIRTNKEKYLAIMQMNKELECQGAKISEITETCSRGNATLKPIELTESKILIANEKKGLASFFKSVGKSIKGIFSSKQKNNNIYSNVEKKVTIDDEDFVDKLISKQNFVEGFWDLNEITELVKNKYNKNFNSLKEIKDKTIDDRVAITILIIYFITKKHSELLNELIMIMEKAKSFINKETKDSYESIIKQIGLN